jgi:hypothetical protein
LVVGADSEADNCQFVIHLLTYFGAKLLSDGVPKVKVLL